MHQYTNLIERCCLLDEILQASATLSLSGTIYILQYQKSCLEWTNTYIAIAHIYTAINCLLTLIKVVVTHWKNLAIPHQHSHHSICTYIRIDINYCLISDIQLQRYIQKWGRG